MGDAAHALAPMLAQGTSLAIEDAYILFHCLDKCSNKIAYAVQRYEELRTEKCSRIAELEKQSLSRMLDTEGENFTALINQLRQVDLLSMYAYFISLVALEASRTVAQTVDKICL